MPNRLRKTYYVERVSRCVAMLGVQAKTAAEAKRLAEAGDYDELDAYYELRGYGRVLTKLPRKESERDD